MFPGRQAPIRCHARSIGSNFPVRHPPPGYYANSALVSSVATHPRTECIYEEEGENNCEKFIKVVRMFHLLILPRRRRIDCTLRSALYRLCVVNRFAVSDGNDVRKVHRRG